MIGSAQELLITIRAHNLATQEVNRVNASFKNLKRTLIGVGAALGGLYALRLAFREVVQPAVEFDQAMRQIWTITNASWGEIQKLGQELRGLAKEYGKAADEVAWGFYEIKSSGFEGADALKILEASLKGSVGGLADLQELAGTTASILNAWSMSAEKAEYVNDILFKTVDLGRVKISEIASDFGRLAGIAAPLGANLIELAAALSTLTVQGVPVHDTITAIRQAVIQLAKPTKVTAQIIADLGYESGVAMIQQLGFAQALAEVTQYAEENNIKLTDMFTNVRAILAVLPLATTAADTYARHQELIANSAGKVDEAYGKMAEGIKHKVNVMWSALKDLEIALTETIIDPLTTIINFLTDALNHLKDFIDKWQELLNLPFPKAWKRFWSGGTAEVLGIEEKPVPEWPSFSRQAQEALYALTDLFSREWWSKFGEAFRQEGVAGVESYAKSIAGRLVEALEQYGVPREEWNKVVQAMAALLSKEYANDVVNAWRDYIDDLTSQMEAVAKETFSLGTSLTTSAGNLINRMGGIAQRAITLGQTVGGTQIGAEEITIPSLITPSTAGGVQGAIEKMLQFLDQFNKSLISVADEVRQAWDKVIASVGDADRFKDAFEEFWKVLSGAYPDVKDLFSAAKEFAHEAENYPEIIQSIYDKLVERQQLEEALAQATAA